MGVRDSVEEDQNKRSKADFVLWFTKSKFEDQALKWDSPLGRGLSRLAHRVLLHLHEISGRAAGHPLRRHRQRLPHHTNEIAQSEAYLGHPGAVLDARPPSEHRRRKNEQIQGGVPHRLPPGGEGYDPWFTGSSASSPTIARASPSPGRTWTTPRPPMRSWWPGWRRWERRALWTRTRLPGSKRPSSTPWATT